MCVGIFKIIITLGVSLIFFLQKYSVIRLNNINKNINKIIISVKTQFLTARRSEYISFSTGWKI